MLAECTRHWLVWTFYLFGFCVCMERTAGEQSRFLEQRPGNSRDSQLQNIGFLVVD